MGLLDGVGGAAGRLGAAAQNALEVARMGGLETGEQPAPFEVVARDGTHRLRRYFATPDDTDNGPPILLVPPMMLAAEVYDVSPQTSGVRSLHAGGLDPWVVDFGAPEHEEGGLERTLADHVLAVSSAIDKVREVTGRDVHLSGYSQGGMFCYQTAALRRGEGIASLITFGSPVDTREAIPFGLPEEAVARVAGLVLGGVGGPKGLPAWASRLGFRLLDPAKAVRQQVEFFLALHDREALLPREGQRRFLQGEGWVAYPGPALADLMRQFVVQNRMLRGGFLIEDRLVTLADIACPTLIFVGEVDEIAPPAAVRAIVYAAPRAQICEKSLRAGHFGLVVGGTSNRETWPAVAGYVRHIETGSAMPDGIGPSDPIAAADDRPGVPARVTHGLSLSAEVASGLVRTVGTTATRTAETLKDLGAEAVVALPRLTRLERLRPGTRVSLGLLLDEQTEKAPNQHLFLFEDRAHTHAAAKHRIDSVVRGLLSLGIRQGEHVGVLMDMRPSALVTVAALNRLGAVGVLLRPDGEVGREARLGRVTRIVTDPERTEDAARAGVQVLVLGGGAQERDLGPGVVDMERIDPDEVELPAWYRPNPGRARDLAFLLFTGEGDRTRVNRITNRRWALSAFGTASSAALDDQDTVYVVTPVHHPSALLTGLGGAIAGGSRIALARHFDATTYWDEVRRYGVTVATYTWTMLRELTEAPPHPGERHHPVRLFVGSGMPMNLWRRVIDRFAPARPLEFYTSPEGEAILVNLTGSKPGAMGRPLPGSAEVRIAAWDVVAGRLDTKEDGFARRCRTGEAGVLLARVDPDTMPGGESPLRGVFARDDAWVSTGDLFTTDEDGDLWLVDPLAVLVKTSHGPVPPSHAARALQDLDAIDLVVAYGIPARGAGCEQLVAAVTVREGHELSADEVTAALRALRPEHRPVAVRVTDVIETTTWWRPKADEQRAKGLRAAGDRLLRWDGRARRYAERRPAAKSA